MLLVINRRDVPKVGKIPVVFITDNNYAVPTAVAIQSLKDNFFSEGKLLIYVIGNQLSKEYKARFKKFNDDKTQLRIIDFEEKLEKEFQEKSYVTRTALIKFAIPRLLFDYEKILYLDSDVLVRGDISSLLNIDIEGYYCAAVADLVAMNVLGCHKKINRMRFFNSGVILINAKRCREEKIEEKLFKWKMEHPEYMFMDQNALNAEFHDEVRYLSPVWNAMIFNILEEKISLNYFNSFYHTDYKDIQEMKETANILHLTNKYKPWKYTYVFGEKEWMDVFKMTSFKDVLLNLKPNPQGLLQRINKDINIAFNEVDVLIERIKTIIIKTKISKMTENKKAKQVVLRERDYQFPWRAITPGATIIIYGGGTIGKSFLGQINRMNYCHVAAICDGNCQGKELEDLPVVTIRELAGWDNEQYDVVLIAEGQRDIAKKAFRDLEMAGIPVSKIKWLDPIKRD